MLHTLNTLGLETNRNLIPLVSSLEDRQNQSTGLKSLLDDDQATNSRLVSMAEDELFAPQKVHANSR